MGVRAKKVPVIKQVQKQEENRVVESPPDSDPDPKMIVTTKKPSIKRYIDDTSHKMTTDTGRFKSD